MTYSEILSVTSNWAAILTAVVATTAYGRYLWVQLSQRRTLEGHLRKEKISGVGSGKRTVMHLMANLALTESEVLSAAFRSKKISPVVGVDDKGRADTLLFEYTGEDLVTRTKF
jgi:hypothetical protein